MRVLSFSGNMSRHPERTRSLRGGVRSGECTIIDLLGVSDFDEGFTSALLSFLKRSLKSRANVVLVADGNVAQRLKVYGLQRVARIVADRDTGVKLAATVNHQLEVVAIPRRPCRR